MENLLEDLTFLSKQSHLIPAEEIIGTKLLNFENLFSFISEKFYDEIETQFFKIININSGNLSINCCYKIGKCLNLLYSKSKTIKLWNLITQITKKITNSNIYILGYLIRIKSNGYKAVISSFLKILFDNFFNYSLPSMISIRCCILSSFNEIKPFLEKIFNLCKKTLLIKDLHLQIFTIRTIRSTLKELIIPIKKYSSLINDSFKVINDPFLLDELTFLIAKISYCFYIKYDINKKNDNNEFSIVSSKENNSNILLSLNYLHEFSNHFSQIFRHFLDLLNPQYIYDNLYHIFQFIRIHHHSDISQLLSSFGEDIRSQIFNVVMKEQPPTINQLLTLKSLVSNKLMVQEVCALAFQISNNPSEDIKFNIMNIFSSMSSHYPDIASNYLESTIIYLAYPPEDNPTINEDIIGMGNIFTSILGGSSLENNIQNCEKLKNEIFIFLNRVLNSNKFFSNEILIAYQIMIVLPEQFIPKELVEKNIENFYNFIQKDSSFILKNKIFFRNLFRTITSFFSSYSFISLSYNIFDYIFHHPSYQSQNVYISSLLYCLNNSNNIINSFQTLKFVTQKFLLQKLTLEYFRFKIKNPILLEHELLFHSIPILSKNKLLFEKINSLTFSM